MEDKLCRDLDERSRDSTDGSKDYHCDMDNLLEKPKDVLDYINVRKEMDSEGVFNNQQHYIDELNRRMMVKKQERRQRKKEAVVKLCIYNAWLAQQRELLSGVTSESTLEKYYALIDKLSLLRLLKKKDWLNVSKGDILTEVDDILAS